MGPCVGTVIAGPVYGFLTKAGSKEEEKKVKEVEKIPKEEEKKTQ